MTTAMLHLEVVGSSPRTAFNFPRSPTAQLIHLSSRRGLARTPLDDEHLIENIKDTDLLHRPYGHNIQTALESHRDSPCSSGQSSPTIIEAQSPVSQSYWGWTTGNTTDRSSPDSSYCLDVSTDFDRKAASKVQQHFEEIQSMLFEGPRENLAQQAEVVKECWDWSSQFPHLRILGQQASPGSAKDTGYHMIETSQELRPAASNYLLDISGSDSSLASSDPHGLVLTGRSVSANRIPGYDGQSSELSFLVEEVIEEEGVYEDIIAVDYKNSYEDNMEFKKQITPRKRRVGYPPVTPSACVKDSVTSAAFDHIWQEILSWLRPLLLKYSSVITDSKHDILTFSPAENHPPLPSMATPPYFSNSRQNSFHRSNTHIGGSTERSFDGILQISSIPLMNRAGELAEAHGPTLLGPSLGGPSLVSQQMRPTNHPRILRKGRLLAPIANKFTAEEERPSRNTALDALRVKKLTPNANENLPSPPYKHGTLPPLDDARLQKKFQPGNRAASAIDNKDTRLLPYREKPHFSELARPNTTHAMRYDSPYGGSSLRRSSTPLANHLLTRNNSLVNKSLDIRGNSLQPASDVLHAHSHPDIQEDQQESPQEGGAEEEAGYSPHWTVSQPASYGRNRLTLK
ncbi:unnamed protein product [Lymnaea stagnalis]|uniref:DUF3719 domain-containing protein n=1 Tax=Lymnaea stagnalis TaxID=6523 RepID=A0AAV2HYA7_LYMST